MYIGDIEPNLQIELLKCSKERRNQAVPHKAVFRISYRVFVGVLECAFDASVVPHQIPGCKLANAAGQLQLPSTTQDAELAEAASIPLGVILY